MADIHELDPSSTRERKGIVSYFSKIWKEWREGEVTASRPGGKYTVERRTRDPKTGEVETETEEVDETDIRKK